MSVAPLSGYAKPDECASYRPLAYAQNRQRDARFSIKTNMPTSCRPTLNVMMNYYCIAVKISFNFSSNWLVLISCNMTGIVLCVSFDC